MDIQPHDPQRLLKDLAEEYERSTRFLQQLESTLTKGQQDTTVLNTSSTSPLDQDDPDSQPASPASQTPDPRPPGPQRPKDPSPRAPIPNGRASPSPQPTPPESAPAKLKAKLRSFFGRRIADTSQAGPKAQPDVSDGPACSGTAAPAAIAAPPQAVAARPVTGRRASMVHFEAHDAAPGSRSGRFSIDMGDLGPGSSSGASERPVTGGRRASVVYFGGCGLEAAGQAADVRTAGGVLGMGVLGIGGSLEDASPVAAPRRPATARRSSVVSYTTSGTVTASSPAAEETARAAGAGGSSGNSAVSVVAERPVTGRRASVVFIGGGGVLDAPPDAADLLPRRTSSFHQQRASAAASIGGALQPTTNRLHSARRTSIDVHPHPGAGPVHGSGAVHHAHTVNGTSRISLEGPQQVAGRPDMQLLTGGTLSGGTLSGGPPSSGPRRASLESARPQSVRAFAAAGAPQAAVNINGSSLFISSVSTATQMQGQQQLQQQQQQQEARLGKVSQLRLQPPSPGVHQAWAVTGGTAVAAATSSLPSPGSGPVSPSEALLVGSTPTGRGTGAARAGAAAADGSRRTSLSLSRNNSMKRRMAGSPAFGLNTCSGHDELAFSLTTLTDCGTNSFGRSIDGGGAAAVTAEAAVSTAAAPLSCSVKLVDGVGAAAGGGRAAAAAAAPLSDGSLATNTAAAAAAAAGAWVTSVMTPSRPMRSANCTESGAASAVSAHAATAQYQETPMKSRCALLQTQLSPLMTAAAPGRATPPLTPGALLPSAGPSLASPASPAAAPSPPASSPAFVRIRSIGSSTTSEASVLRGRRSGVGMVGGTTGVGAGGSGQLGGGGGGGNGGGTLLYTTRADEPAAVVAAGYGSEISGHR